MFPRRIFARLATQFRRPLLFFLLTLVFVLLSLSVHLFIYLFSNWIYPLQSVEYSSETVKLIDNQPIILLWTGFFEAKNWEPHPIDKSTCGCFFTRDRNLLKYSQYVVLHWRDTDLTDLPIKYKGQRWIWFDMEPPKLTHRPHIIRKIESNFDCWATYRHDSDILTSYGQIAKLDQPVVIPKVNLTSKPKLIAWMVSNCYDQSGRSEYVEQLAKYISVDIYGKCGTLECPRSSEYERENCWQMIADNYKFYLSFENSLCADYATEKLFEVLERNIVPVVFGSANYSAILPENSFIDALSFQSPKQLAEFLNQLAQDELRYNSYLNWKSNYKVNYQDTFCSICERFSGNQSYTCHGETASLYNWWFINSKCKTWTPKHGIQSI